MFRVATQLILLDVEVTFTTEMADIVARPSSPPLSVSLLEIEAETRLVLKSFLRNTLAVAPGERPGRIGGEYHDPYKYSALKGRMKKDGNGWDSLDEEISAAEEKKHGIKNLIKRRLRPRSSTSRAKKSGSAEPTPNNTLEKQSLPAQPEKPSTNGAHSLPRKTEEEMRVPSSASEEEGDKKSGGKNKKKKKKSTISDLFKKVSFKKEEPRPQRPTKLPINYTDSPELDECLHSPSHPPAFYDDVAETLDRIAQKHSMKKRSPVKPMPLPSAPKENDKEAMVQQLVQILASEGDAINEKINDNPFLRSTLTRLSYPSFAKLLDMYASQSEDPHVPPPVSPTLRRMAITMEASRRVVTATGAHRLTVYAERYMESFAPWLRSHGGWENIAQLDDSAINQSHLEYD